MPEPETLAAHVVTTVYQSQPEAAMFEQGFEVQVVTLTDGATHSVGLFDHTDANMIEMPPEVAVAISWVISQRLSFQADQARLQPPISADPSGDAQVVSIYRSSKDPAMNEAGYDLQVEVTSEGLITEVILIDTIGRDRLVMPAAIARSVALALTAYPLFPIKTLN